MTPNGPLTEDRVWRMIKEEIEMNNVGIERRQNQILDELKEVKEALSETTGVRKLAIWGLPLLVAAIGLAAEIIRSSHH